MAFPITLQLISLSGTFLDGDGNPRAGVVRITLPTPIRSEGDDVVIPPFDLEAELDTDGSFSIDLPATTDSQWLPNTAEYVVQASFSEDFRKLWWTFPLPFDTAGDALDLADVGAPNVGTPSLTIRQGTTQPLADGGYKGTWAIGTLYRTGDTVQHGSTVYGALRASTGVTPGTLPTTWKTYPSSGGGAVDSVNGETGDVVLTASDIGLGNVNNTSDAAKPVSVLQQAELDDRAALVHGHIIAEVSGLAGALALLAPLESPPLTGTATMVNLTQTGRYLSTPDVLVDAATIAVNAALGNDFTVTLGGDRTLGNPTNAVNGQKIMFAIRQDGTGNHVITLDSNYRLGADISSVVLSTAAGKTDYLGVRYNGADSKWDVIAFVKGY